MFLVSFIIITILMSIMQDNDEGIFSTIRMWHQLLHRQSRTRESTISRMLSQSTLSLTQWKWISDEPFQRKISCVSNSHHTVCLLPASLQKQLQISQAGKEMLATRSVLEILTHLRHFPHFGPSFFPPDLLSSSAGYRAVHCCHFWGSSSATDVAGAQPIGHWFCKKRFRVQALSEEYGGMLYWWEAFRYMLYSNIYRKASQTGDQKRKVCKRNSWKR